jgi:hypothetical protein
MTQRTLDWKPNFDPRSMGYTIQRMDCYSTNSKRASIIRRKYVWLDQGVEGACTGFGMGHVLTATPKLRKDIDNQIAREIYYEARRQDEWDGEDYEGSSVNGACRAARLRGYIKEWRWCYTLDEVRHALSWHGPIEIGVNWYTGMFDPDHMGYIAPTGRIEGGHALMLAGYNADVFRLENSWGQEWGSNGGAYIYSKDLQKLLEEDGEFACPVKAPQ